MKEENKQQLDIENSAVVETESEVSAAEAVSENVQVDFVTPVEDSDKVNTVTETSSEPDAEQKARKKRKMKIVFTVLFILAMVAIIAYTAITDFTGESMSGDSLAQTIGKNWYYLLVLLGLFAVTVLMEALKVFLMIRKTTRTYKFGTSFCCATLGRFYDYVTPLGSGGQPFQIYYLAKHDIPSGPAGAIPLGSLILTQFSFTVCAIVSFIIGVSEEIVPIYVQILSYFGTAFYIAIPLFLLVFSFMPKAGYKVIAWGVKVLTKLRICKHPERWIAKGNAAIDNNKKNMAILFKSKRVLIVCTLISFVYMIALYSMPYFSLLLFEDALIAANLVPSWDLWFEITRITFYIHAAVAIIPTPGNSGAADGTFYGLFRSVLITVVGASFTCMMIWRFYSYYLYLILGVIVVIYIKIADRIRAKRNQLGKLS